MAAEDGANAHGATGSGAASTTGSSASGVTRTWSWYSDNLGEPANRVLPELALFIGGADARDRSWLAQTGITHIVDASNMRLTMCEPLPKHVRVLRVPVDDAPACRIDQHFGQSNHFIDEAIEGGGRVLVHCMAGVSRSASLVIAFLIWKRNWTMRAALASLERARPIVNPNAGFRKQLLEYEAKVHEVTKGLRAPLPP